MSDSVKSIVKWAIFTIILSIAVGLWLQDMGLKYKLYALIVVSVYFAGSYFILKEKIEMMKIEQEIRMMLKKKRRKN
jgi:uncharacterized membrane protein YiaA